MKHKISVAMATFAGERFISQQLDSILCQSLMPDEIIICDDSRNEKTYKAIENIIAQHPNTIKYFKNETQLGVSKNFEKAISLSSGDIIFLSDQDDVWRQDKIAQLASLVKASPNCGGAFCDSELVNEELKPLGVTHWSLRGFQTNDMLSCPLGGMLEFFLKRVPAAGHNIAFKSKFKEILLPFPDLEECHDTWIGLVIVATTGWGFTSDTLTKFRQHENNVSQAGRKSQLGAALASIKNDTNTWNMTLYNELIKRLTGKIKPETLEMLKDRQEHSATRVKMSCNTLKRLPLVYREIKNRRYFKYGRGWKNIIQDLVLRGF